MFGLCASPDTPLVLAWDLGGPVGFPSTPWPSVRSMSFEVEAMYTTVTESLVDGLFRNSLDLIGLCLKSISVSSVPSVVFRAVSRS